MLATSNFNPDNHTMEQHTNPESKKRGIGYLAAAELSWKLKSKADLMQYLDKHSKYLATSFLTSL